MNSDKLIELRKNIFSFMLAGSSTIILILVGFASGKIVSNELGVTGMAVYGIFINLISIAFVFSNGGISNGIISQNTWELEKGDKKRFYLYKIMTITFFFSIALSSIMFITSNVLASRFFHQPILEAPLKFAAITLFFVGFNTSTMSYVNAISDLKKLTKLKILQNAFSLFSLLILVFFYRSQGVFYALSLGHVLFFSYVFISDASIRNSILSVHHNWLDFALIKIFLTFSITTLSSALIGPFSQLLIRNIIVHDFGEFDGGLWQSVIRLSDGYMLLFTTAIFYMYLPGINKAKTNNALKKYILSVFIPLTSMALVSLIVLFFFRYEIVNLLYNNKFAQAGEMLLFQLGGDFFKIISYSFIFVLIAKGNYKGYLIIEVIFAFLEVLLTYQMSLHGFEFPAVKSHLVSMIVLCGVLMIYRSKILNVGE
jgi:O-antigen/teichoic acid export membrane protein